MLGLIHTNLIITILRIHACATCSYSTGTLCIAVLYEDNFAELIKRTSCLMLLAS